MRSRSLLKTSALVMLLAAAASAAEVEDGSIEHPYIVNSETIARAYEDNRLAADQKYSGKLLIVVDCVATVDKTILGYPRVKVSVAGDPGGNRTICTFVKSEEITKQLASLHKGDKVAIVGRFNGFRFSVAAMDKCSALKLMAAGNEKDKGS